LFRSCFSSFFVSFAFFCVFVFCCCYMRLLPSFPTRRSSDLAFFAFFASRLDRNASMRANFSCDSNSTAWATLSMSGWASREKFRSEEHTSELQSRFDLVCRLLLEKNNVWRLTQFVIVVFCVY